MVRPRHRKVHQALGPKAAGQTSVNRRLRKGRRKEGERQSHADRALGLAAAGGGFGAEQAGQADQAEWAALPGQVGQPAQAQAVLTVRTRCSSPPMPARQSFSITGAIYAFAGG